MDTKALRQKILDLAIHGKLVPQDPNDEPASVLLERIKAEKERLIKEGKIKRSKKSAKTSDTPHYENVPFEVPESWVWCRLDDIVCELKYGTSEKSSSVGKIAVLRMGNITNVGTIDYSNLVYSSNDEDIEQYSLEKTIYCLIAQIVVNGLEKRQSTRKNNQPYMQAILFVLNLY